MVHLILSLLISQAQAYIPQRGNINASIGPYVYQTKYTGLRANDNDVASGISLLANGDVSDHGSLEMAAIYMRKFYFREDDNKAISEKTQTMHITVGYRRYWTPSFSASLSIYTNYGMGEVSTIHSDFTTADNMDTTARSSSESGLDLALQEELWRQDRFSLMVEGRYSYAISKKSHEYSDQYGASIALRYFIQSHVKKPKELNQPKIDQQPNQR